MPPCCDKGVVVNYWSAVAQHLAMAKGCWSAIGQLSSCCGQGLVVNYLAVVRGWCYSLLWSVVGCHLIMNPSLKEPFGCALGRNEKRAAKHANNSKGDKHHTSKHLTHKHTGKGASKQAGLQANQASKPSRPNMPSKPTVQSRRQAKQANRATRARRPARKPAKQGRARPSKQGQASKAKQTRQSKAKQAKQASKATKQASKQAK